MKRDVYMFPIRFRIVISLAKELPEATTILLFSFLIIIIKIKIKIKMIDFQILIVCLQVSGVIWRKVDNKFDLFINPNRDIYIL